MEDLPSLNLATNWSSLSHLSFSESEEDVSASPKYSLSKRSSSCSCLTSVSEGHATENRSYRVDRIILTWYHYHLKELIRLKFH